MASVPDAPPSTLRTAEAPRAGAAGRRRPFLLVVGSAASAGAPPGDRLIGFERALEIGRCPTATAEAAPCAFDDPWVSSRHARIAVSDDGFVISDLGSRNGTTVDGRPVKAPVPLHDGSLVFLGGHALLFRRLNDDELAALGEERAAPFGPVATASAPLALVLRRLRRLAPTAEDILVTGETGVGKEVYAQAVHRASRRPGRFVALNCAALPTELVESELFGYQRGAHSQAARSKPGLIEQAAGGTLFLDEIGEMPLGAQAKLLRFMQEREYTPLGGHVPKRIDVRIVAATRTERLADGSLREDLAARLGAEPLVLPPLRHRREDIGALTARFLAPRAPVALASAAFQALCAYDWPRNVRELEKTLREAAIYSAGEETIRLEHLPAAVGARVSDAGVNRPPQVMEQVRGPEENRAGRRRPRPAPSLDELDALMAKHHGVIADVARELDRRWAVVWRWLLKFGLSPERYRR